MSNPGFRIFDPNNQTQERILQGEPMTVNGTIQITAFLGLIIVMTAGLTWAKFMAGYTDLVQMLAYGGGIVGFILGLIIIFKRVKNLIPVYAMAEGLFIGGISAFFESIYPGIVMQAVAGTFAALFSMLILYKIGLIKSTDKFRSVISISTASVCSIYLVDFIGHFFGYSVPLINTSTTFGILFSLAVIAIAALNLIIDFDIIEKGQSMMLPKDYEWFGAFGLTMTLIWLYVEILKLLAKLNSRD